MPTQIIIEGDMVRTVETNVISQIRLEDLLPRIESRPPVFIGALPKTAKFLYYDESNPDQKRMIVFAELEPGRRACRYDNRRYNLSIPWTYFRFDFRAPNDARNDNWQQTNSRVYWAREEATNLQSEIGRALVPNCGIGGDICYGTTAIPANINLGPRVDRLVHSFYATTFMHDSGAGSPWGRETGSTSWNRWALESRDDQHAWRRFPEWEDNGRFPSIGPMAAVQVVLADISPRATFTNIEDAIPPMQIPFTVGRAIEWFGTSFTPDQRLRMRLAMDAAIAEGGPGFAVAAPPRQEQIEDIGVLIADEQ